LTPGACPPPTSAPCWSTAKGSGWCSLPLNPADTNGLSDIFRLGLIGARLALLSATPAGRAFNGTSIDPAADADGELVVFASTATDLVGDTDTALSDLLL
jgi:hypothetical protein